MDSFEGWLERYCPSSCRRRIEGAARFEIATLILHHALWIALPLAFWLSGLNGRLAGDLRAHLGGDGWLPWAYLVHAALSVLSYEILLFPLTYALECVRERFRLPPADGAEEEPATFGAFLHSYFWSLAVEVLLFAGALVCIQLLRRFLGTSWWVAVWGFYALLQLDSFTWFRPVRDRKVLDDAGFLRLVRDAFAKLGGRSAAVCVDAVELDSREPDPARLARLLRSPKGAGRTVVVAKDCWMALTEPARLFLVVREEAFRRSRRLLRAINLALAAVAFCLGSWASDAIAARMGWGNLAAPEAVPVLVIVYFSLALLFGIVLKFIARRLNLRCDLRAARAHPDGVDALADTLRQLFSLTEQPPSLPRWCTLFLFEYAPLSRIRRVARALGRGRP